MEDVKIYKCFIASPSDTKEERDACEEVFSEINNTVGSVLHFRLESLRWEKDVHPAIGAGGQEVINRQVNGKYDLFVGIMYLKFGSPTDKYGSGTEEEFYNAYDEASKSKSIDIMFYFNDAPIEPSKINNAEYLKVKHFKDQVQEKCLYATYAGVDDFKSKLKNHLILYFKEKLAESASPKDYEQNLRVVFKLEENLNHSLRMFCGQPIVWVEPNISRNREIPTNPDLQYDGKVTVSELIETPQDRIISAPPQFGLTCLSHYIALEAWKAGKVWVRVDMENLKTDKLDQYIHDYLYDMSLPPQTKVDGIIVDSYKNGGLNIKKKLNVICSKYPTTPIVLMRTVENAHFVDSKQDPISINREFEALYLLPMTKNQIRKIISEYNKKSYVGEDNEVLEKIISDITILNIHRTPQNCMTLLKVDEKNFDANPVNRAQLLEDVLYVLFESGNVPKYDNDTPDVKDCQYVMGDLCENLIRKEQYSFSESDFFSITKSCCEKKFLDVNVKVLFEILCQNNIINKDANNQYYFKSGFWMLYFAAVRMKHEKSFSEYIFASRKYLTYPEIMEFYTGIDRNRDDALEILHKDITDTCREVIERLNIPNTINPYKYAVWRPTIEHIQRVQQEIGENVLASGLPVEIKDHYSDTTYNQIRPFNQTISIHDFFEEYFVYNLIQEIKSSSRALRNSDYASVDVRKTLVQEILQGWLQIDKILLALLPILSSKKRAEIGGINFMLEESFEEMSEEERARTILLVIMINVVGHFKDDIYSPKIAPLLYDAYKEAQSPLIKHQLMLLFVTCRPKHWQEYVEQYIIALPKESFFLFDIVNEMRAQYKYGFMDDNDSRRLAAMIKKCYAKHEFGARNPSQGQMNKILPSVLPKRTQEE